MPDYLSPSIGMILPQLEQTCNDLIRQSLVRALTDYTKQLCEFDPELADILLEGTKTLLRCVCYVIEKAQRLPAAGDDDRGGGFRPSPSNRPGPVRLYGGDCHQR